MVSAFQEIRDLLNKFPAPDDAGGATLHTDLLSRYGAEAEDLASAAAWLATWRGPRQLSIQRPRLVLFAGSYACPGFSMDILRRKIQAVAEGTSALKPVCESIDMDVRLYELDIDTPAADFARGDAMTEADSVRAIAYGMMAVEAGVDLLCIGHVDAGQGGAVDALTKAVPQKDPLEALCRFGGYDIAAMVGAILAARMGRVPVILGTSAAMAAAQVLSALNPASTHHCRVVQAGRLVPLPAALLDEKDGDILAAVLSIPFLRIAAKLV